MKKLFLIGILLMWRVGQNFMIAQGDSLNHTHTSIQEGVKFYFGSGIGASVLSFVGLAREARDEYPDIYQKDPNSFSNVREDKTYHYWMTSWFSNLDIQYRGFIFRLSYSLALFPISKDLVIVNRGYGFETGYNYIWFGYSHRYKNKKWNFSVLWGSSLLSEIFAGLTDLYILEPLKISKDKGGVEIKSNPYNIKGVGVNLYFPTLSLYGDVGMRLKERWYASIYFYLHRIEPFTEDAMGLGNFDNRVTIVGAMRQIGLSVNFLLNNKKKK